MTDRAPQIAAYLVDHQADAFDAQGLLADIARRWPGLTIEETIRAMRIAEEILAGTIVEGMAALGVVEITQAERGTHMAAVIAPFDESGLLEIAERAGIPVEAVREVMQALQRGASLPPPDDGLDERSQRPC